MYSAARYRLDLKRSSAPLRKAAIAFGKSLLRLVPFTSFGLCCYMVALFMVYVIQCVWFSMRRLTNF